MAPFKVFLSEILLIFFQVQLQAGHKPGQTPKDPKAKKRNETKKKKYRYYKREKIGIPYPVLPGRRGKEIWE